VLVERREAIGVAWSAIVGGFVVDRTVRLR
jgi:hypothetical protein